jgi:hypothetical protein
VTKYREGVLACQEIMVHGMIGGSSPVSALLVRREDTCRVILNFCKISEQHRDLVTATRGLHTCSGAFASDTIAIPVPVDDPRVLTVLVKINKL